MIESGVLQSGSAADLAAADGKYLSVASAGPSSQEVSWYGVIADVPRTLDLLQVDYSGYDSFPNPSAMCRQVIAIRNWTSHSYVPLDRRTVGSTPVAATGLQPPGALSDYVSENGEVWVRVSCARKAGSFVAFADQLNLVYRPSKLPVWLSRYDGPAHDTDEGNRLAVSPDGSKVFVTGASFGSTGYEYATAAYDADSGAQLWVSRYGPGGGAAAYGLSVSPDGSKVFVTGLSWGGTTGFDYATVAYDPATGAQLWVSRYNGPANLDDAAWALSVSPDGSKVFVTGQSDGAAATVAYKAATGAQLWVSRYSVAGNTSATNLAVSPDGTKLFVTGFSEGHYGTVAYDSVSGTQLWVRRYNGPANFRDQPTGLSVSPDGSKVFVTGQSYGLASEDYATVAYRAASGAQLWVSRYDGGAEDAAKALSVSPDGSQLFVTGVSWRSRSGYDYLTVAYNAASGAERWTSRYSGPADGGDGANSVVVSPDGSAVFVTGQSSGLMSGSDYATVAYGTGRGMRLWVSRYSGNGGDTAEDIGVSPDGSKVFVTGTSQAADGNSDYATLAYSSH